VQRVEELLAERAPHLAKSKRNLQSNVIINTVKALLPLTETDDQNYRKQVIEEIKIILLKYIEFVIMAKEEKPK
jgi:Tetracyclin repressor-like, C-terminal domain